MYFKGDVFRFLAGKVINALLNSYRIPERYEKRLTILLFPRDSLPHLDPLSTSPNKIKECFCQNIRDYNKSIAPGCVKNYRMACAPKRFTFTETRILQCRVYHYLGATVPFANNRFSLLSVYMSEIDGMTQGDAQQAQMYTLNSALHAQHTLMLHKYNQYLQSFLELWA